MQAIAKRIDSNVVNFERTVRELPSAILSVTLPILLIGIAPDEKQVDVSKCSFAGYPEIVGKKKSENRWRIVNGYLSGTDVVNIGPQSPTGPMLDSTDEEEEEEPDAEA